MMAFLQVLLLVLKVAEFYFFGLLFLSILVSVWSLTDEQRAIWKESRRKARVAKAQEKAKAWTRHLKEGAARKAMETARHDAFMNDPYVCGFDRQTGQLLLGEWHRPVEMPAAQRIWDEMEKIVQAEQDRIKKDDHNVDFFANLKDL